MGDQLVPISEKAILNKIKPVLQTIFYYHDLHFKRVVHCGNIRLTFEGLDTTDDTNTHELLCFRKSIRYYQS